MSKLARRLTLPAAALLAGACLLAGCGSGDSASNDSKPRVKGTDIGAAPREELRDGGTIRWAVDQFSTQWNLNELDGPAVATATVTNAVMPATFVADDKANLTVDTDYVTSAKVTATEPKQEITYELNPKASWSDGKPITWKDYEAQWKAMRNANGPYLVVSDTGYSSIESVERGADDYEFKVTFKKPFADWQSLWNPLYPASTNSDPKVFNEGWVNKIPVTAGPFKLGSIDKTAKTVTAERDPNWWGKPAKLDRIITRALDSDASVNAFVNGEVDVVDLGGDASNYKRAKGAQNGDVREAAGPDFRHFTLNGTSDNLSDVRVRQAVQAGIDRQAIARADLVGLPWPAVTLGNHFFVNTQAGYEDNSGEFGRYDPDRAKQLLDQAGWVADGAVRKKNGKPLTLRFVIPAGYPVSKQEAELTQAMLAKIGVKVDIVTTPIDAFFDKYVVPGNFDITAFSYAGTPFPISSAEPIYAKPETDKNGEIVVEQNVARIGTDEIDALMAKANATLDFDQARATANEADKGVWEEGHSLTLYQAPQIWGGTQSSRTSARSASRRRSTRTSASASRRRVRPWACGAAARGGDRRRAAHLGADARLDPRAVPGLLRRTSDRVRGHPHRSPRPRS